MKNQLNPMKQLTVLSLAAFFLLILRPVSIHAKKNNVQPMSTLHADRKLLNFSNEDILKNSHLSYRAEGGFSGVEGYSVLINCVNGKISTLATIRDPHVLDQTEPLRRAGSMDEETYLNLWADIKRMGFHQKNNAPPLKQDSYDEFDVAFEMGVGNWKHTFSAVGLSRPEASSYFALRSLLDQASQMSMLWTEHHEFSKN